MPDTIVKLGLIGAGRWGRNYIKTIRQLDGVALAGLATQNPDSKKLVDQHCMVVADWRELLQHKDIQGIILAVPAPQQFDIAVAVVESNKALLLEKPMTLSSHKAIALQQRIQKHQAVAMIDHTQLFDPAFRALKQQLNGQKINKLSITAGKNGGFRRETSVLWDWGPHVVAMCLDLLNESLTQLHAHRIVSDKTVANYAENLCIKCLSELSHVSVEMNIGNLFEQKKRLIEVHTDTKQYVYRPDADVPLVCRENGKEARIEVDYRPPLSVVVEEFSGRIKDQDRRLDQVEQGVQVVTVLEILDKQLANECKQQA